MSEMSRREFSCMMASGAAFAQREAAGQNRRPNILFICSDEHAGPYMGCQGHPLVRTPHMDALAARGTLFRNAYSNAPVCVPGRAALMTGRFASDVSSFSNSTCFAGGVPTWGNLLRDASYHCWATGKLDLTVGKDYGFHEVETDHGHSIHPDITSLFQQPVSYRVDIRGSIDGQFTQRTHADAGQTKTALDFLRNEAAKSDHPWVAYVGLTLPHPPMIAQPKYAEMYPPAKMPLPDLPPGHVENLHLPLQILRHFLGFSVPFPAERVRRSRAAYFGMISELDEYVGQLVAEVERQGMMENTLIVYTSDHGEMLGEHGLWTKFNLLENSARIPMIVAGPGFPRGKVVDTPVAAVDLTPTLLEAAGAQRAPGLRGHPLVGLANGNTKEHPGFAYSESLSEGNCTGSYMIRQGDWKYIHYTWYGDLLFNLKDDPGEFHNLAGNVAHRDVEQQLRNMLHGLVDPEAVTRRSFDRHDEVLRDLIQKNNAAQFYALLEKRMGAGLAHSMTYLHYKREG